MDVVCAQSKQALSLVFPEFFTLLLAPFAGAIAYGLYRRLPRRRLSLSGWVGEKGGARAPAILWLPLFGWSVCGKGRIKAGFEVGAVSLALWALVLSGPDGGRALCVTACLGWGLMTLAALDLRHRLLPDTLTMPLALAGMTFAPAISGTGSWDHVLGALIGGGALWAVVLISRAVSGRDGLGIGDAKLFMAAGAWVGWVGLPSVLLIGAGGGIVHGFLSKKTRQDVPLGTWLAGGIWITWVYGPLRFF